MAQYSTSGMKGFVGRLRLGSVVWLGMILAGACLGAFVFAAWPEPTTRLTRLPYGESRPKTPIAAVERQAPVKRVAATVDVVPAKPEPVVEEESVERELAGPPPVRGRERDRGLSAGDAGGARREAAAGHAPERPEAGRLARAGSRAYVVAAAVRRMPTSCRAVSRVIASPVRPATVKLSWVPPRSTSQPARRPPTGANPANAQR